MTEVGHVAVILLSVPAAELMLAAGLHAVNEVIPVLALAAGGSAGLNARRRPVLQ